MRYQHPLWISQTVNMTIGYNQPNTNLQWVASLCRRLGHIAFNLVLPKKLFQKNCMLFVDSSALVLSQLSALFNVYGRVVFDLEVLQRPDITNVLLLVNPNYWCKFNSCMSSREQFLLLTQNGFKLASRQTQILLYIVQVSDFHRVTSDDPEKYECLPVWNPRSFAVLTIGCQLDVNNFIYREMLRCNQSHRTPLIGNDATCRYYYIGRIHWCMQIIFSS